MSELNWSNPDYPESMIPEGAYEIVIELEDLRITMYAVPTANGQPESEVKNLMTMHAYKNAYMIAEQYGQEVSSVRVTKVEDQMNEIEAFANGEQT